MCVCCVRRLCKVSNIISSAGQQPWCCGGSGSPSLQQTNDRGQLSLYSTPSPIKVLKSKMKAEKYIKRDDEEQQLKGVRLNGNNFEREP